MTSKRHAILPPHFAAWLISLFSGDEKETLIGDLHEEFSQLTSKSGLAFARRWYWRQTWKSIGHLFCCAFRFAPLSTSAAVVVGFLISHFLFTLPEKAMFAVVDRYQLFERHFNFYLFLATKGIAMSHVIASMAVGCVTASIAKGKEMVVTTALVLVLLAMTVLAFIWIATRNVPMMVWGMLQWNTADWLAILIGGVMIRTLRSASPLPKRR